MLLKLAQVGRSSLTRSPRTASALSFYVPFLNRCAMSPASPAKSSGAVSTTASLTSCSQFGEISPKVTRFEGVRSPIARLAASASDVPQSTVSQQIKRLELETKRPLFRRTTRSVALTDDGEMLLGDARRLLQLEEAARQRLAAPRLSGTVRLGVVEEVAGGSLPSALGRFAALHPGVKLEVQIDVSAELIEQLSAGRLDVVFAKRPLGTSKGRLVWRETAGLSRGRHVRSHSRRSAAAGAVSRAVGLMRGSARGAPGRRTHLGDRLHQPEPDRRARGGACRPGHYAASCERGHRGVAHSRCRGRPAASSRP